MQTYETTIAIDSLQKAEEIQSTIGKIETFIKNHGGDIVKRDDWGKKRLAYEINRKQYGTYFHFIFEAPSSIPGLLEGEFRLQETILRYLTVTADSNLVSKVKAQQAEVTPETETETETKAEAETETKAETKAEAVDTEPETEKPEPAVEVQKETEPPDAAEPADTQKDVAEEAAEEIVEAGPSVQETPPKE